MDEFAKRLDLDHRPLVAVRRAGDETVVLAACVVVRDPGSPPGPDRRVVWSEAGRVRMDVDRTTAELKRRGHHVAADTAARFSFVSFSPPVYKDLGAGLYAPMSDGAEARLSRATKSPGTRILTDASPDEPSRAIRLVVGDRMLDPKVLIGVEYAAQPLATVEMRDGRVDDPDFQVDAGAASTWRVEVDRTDGGVALKVSDGGRRSHRVDLEVDRDVPTVTVTTNAHHAVPDFTVGLTDDMGAVVEPHVGSLDGTRQAWEFGSGAPLRSVPVPDPLAPEVEAPIPTP